MRGGHGRTGTIISIIIGILFNLNGERDNELTEVAFKNLSRTGEEALSMNHRLHDQRIRTNGVASPETKSISSLFLWNSNRLFFN